MEFIQKSGKTRRNLNINIKLKKLLRSTEYFTFQTQDPKEEVVELRSLCVILKASSLYLNFQSMFLRILRYAGALSSLENQDL